MYTDRVRRMSMRRGKNELPEGYVLATDDDFSGASNGSFRYIGDEPYIAIPHVIKGAPVTSYASMFANNSMIKGVASNNTNVTLMNNMFQNSQATSLDLSSFDTSNVTDISNMFRGSKATSLDLSSFDTSKVVIMTSMFFDSQATTLDLSSFDTSNVTSMYYMFAGSQSTSLDLSSFDTSNVTNMSGMFRSSKATSLDLSSFDTSKVTNMTTMFYNSQATTGYARTQADADRFNNSSDKPSTLVFVVK